MAGPADKCLHTFTWEIENFLSAPAELKSPPFCVENLNNSKWFIKACFSRTDIDGYVSCYLIPAENNDVKEITCMLELLVGDGKSLTKREFLFNSFENILDIGSEKFISYRKVKEILAHSKEDKIIVRCRIGRDKCYSFSSAEWEAKSIIEVENHSLKFFIRDLNSSLNIEKQFSILQKLLTVKLEESEDNISIKLHMGKYTSFFLVCRVSFLLNGLELYSRRFSGMLRAFEVSTLPSIKKGLLENKKGILTTLFEVSFPIGTISNCTEFIPSDNSASPTSSLCKDQVSVLQEDLKLLFLDKIGCDVKLRAGDEIFSSHKSTLSARSPVFKAMFEQDMVENKTGIVDISDTDAETLKSFLVFCYNATVEEGLDCKRAINLLIMSDKYQVASLKETCSAILISLLNDENVCQVLEVADMISCETLKNCSMRVIKKCAQKVFSSNNWLQCVTNNSKLTIEVLQKLYLDATAN